MSAVSPATIDTPEAPHRTQPGISPDSPTGRWIIPAQQIEVYVGSKWFRRARACTVQGLLAVGDETTLELESVPKPSAQATPEFRFRGALAARDRLGRWRLEGRVETAGSAAPLTIDAAYHGVFRSGARHVVWLVLAGGDRRSGSGDGRSRRVVHGLAGGLNAVLEP